MYMNAQIGISDNAAIAQIGIFGRRFAAAMYGGSGLGGGASVGAGPARRPAGPAGAAAAGVAAAVVAGAAVGAASAAASPLGGASPPPSPSAARRSRERFRRCSGISVIAGQTIGAITDRSGNPGVGVHE